MRLGQPAPAFTNPAAGGEDVNPVEEVARWRAGQVGLAAVESIGDRAKYTRARTRATAQLQQAYRAVWHLDIGLAAALVEERDTAVSLMTALGSAHLVADWPRMLDDAIAAHHAARIATRHLLRDLLIRLYPCDGCSVPQGESCSDECMPSERNDSHQPESEYTPATVYLVLPAAQVESGHVFAERPDAQAFVAAAGVSATVVKRRVVFPDSAPATIAAAGPDLPAPTDEESPR